MGAWILGKLTGFLPKIIANFLAKLFNDWRQRKALQELGASKERERQGDATIEVLSRNAEGAQEADEMSEEERRRRLTDGT